MPRRKRRINEFRDTTGAIDFDRWRNDIIGRLEQVAPDGISTREFCREYFGKEDTETIMLVGRQLSAVREILLEKQRILLNSSYRWYAVRYDDAVRARRFIVERTRRVVRAYTRLENFAEIGHLNYGLPDSDRVLKAIEGAAPTMKQLRESLSSDAPRP